MTANRPSQDVFVEKKDAHFSKPEEVGKNKGLGFQEYTPEDPQAAAERTREQAHRGAEQGQKEASANPRLKETLQGQGNWGPGVQNKDA